jgi:long-chain acyl-CoA synthetase
VLPIAISLLASTSISHHAAIVKPAVMPQDPKKLYPQARAVKTGPVSVEVAGVEKKEGETIPRRNAKSKDALKLKPADNVSTLYELLKYGSAKFGNAKAMGSRRIVNTHVETKKVKKMIDGKQQEVDKNWTYFELSPYKYMSFVEFEKLAHTVGAGLKKLGLNPHDKVHLFAATSSQWLTMAHGEDYTRLPTSCSSADITVYRLLHTVRRHSHCI